MCVFVCLLTDSGLCQLYDTTSARGISLLCFLFMQTICWCSWLKEPVGNTWRLVGQALLWNTSVVTAEDYWLFLDITVNFPSSSAKYTSQSLSKSDQIQEFKFEIWTEIFFFSSCANDIDLSTKNNNTNNHCNKILNIFLKLKFLFWRNFSFYMCDSHCSYFFMFYFCLFLILTN